MEATFGSCREDHSPTSGENKSVELHTSKFFHIKKEDVDSILIKREIPEHDEEENALESLEEGNAQKVHHEGCNLNGNTHSTLQDKSLLHEDAPDNELEFVPVKEEPPDLHELQEDDVGDASTFSVKLEPDNLRSGGVPLKREVNDVGTSVVCDSDFTPLESAFYPAVDTRFGVPEGACQTTPGVKKMRSSVSGVGKKYKCSSCEYTCAQRYNLASHQLARHGVGEPFKCDFCSYTCAQKGSLKAHQISKHELGIPFKCDACDYTCALKCNLKDHQVSKHGPRLTFNCDLCNYTCTQKRSLKMHQVSKHGSGKKPYKCEFCEYTCARKKQLKLHKVSKHAMGDPFLCHLCDYSCPDRYSLKCHQFAKHGIGESHKCEFCNFSSAHTSSFKRHQLAKHGIGDPLRCRICDYSTAYPNVLKQHVTTAHNIGEFLRCDLCDYSTTIKSHMKRHKLGKHNASLTSVCKDPS